MSRTVAYFELLSAEGTVMNVYAYDKATADLLATRLGGTVKEVRRTSKTRENHPSMWSPNKETGP